MKNHMLKVILIASVLLTLVFWLIVFFRCPTMQKACKWVESSNNNLSIYSLN